MRTAMRTAAVVLLAAIGAGVTIPAAASSDEHRGYPAVPSGYSAIVRTFGQPCNADARRNAMTWTAPDNDVTYSLRYHAKLGGTASSNLHDVLYHLKKESHLDEMRSGIYAYACRRKRGDDSEWSVHAWGVTFDVSSRYEHFRHDHCHVISPAAGGVWTTHRWRWGRAWGDCMHMQYATGY